MQIAILLFDRLTALDAVGPYEVFRGLPEADVRFVATAPGPQRTDHGSLALVADHALDGRARARRHPGARRPGGSRRT